jgi:hypothetical protein
MSGMLLFSPLVIRDVELRNRTMVPLISGPTGVPGATWQNGLNDTGKLV